MINVDKIENYGPLQRANTVKNVDFYMFKHEKTTKCGSKLVQKYILKVRR